MSFYERLDVNRTISKSKKVLNEYSRFISIINNSLYEIDATGCTFDKVLTFSNYVNADARLIEAINRKDRNYEEIHKYIKSIQSAINCLKTGQIEILNLKYVNNMSNVEIAERLSDEGKIISERHIARKMKEIYLDFAIAYGIYVIKKGFEKSDLKNSGI